MKTRIRVLNVLFFIILLVLPFQVFAAEQEDEHGHDEVTDDGHEEMDQAEMDAHGHGEEDDHEEMDQAEMDAHGHGEADDHEEMDQAEMDALGHGETDGHEEMDQAEMDAHGHGETDDHGDDGHGDDGHEYEEPGANWPLLGSFAAINGGFMLFGAVRKFNKKRKSGVN